MFSKRYRVRPSAFAWFQYAYSERLKSTYSGDKSVVYTVWENSPRFR